MEFELGSMSDCHRTEPRDRTESEAGAALIMALLVLAGLVVIGLAGLAMADVERLAALNDARAVSVGYAADAGLERTVRDLAQAPDWSLVLARFQPSSMFDADPRPMSPWGTRLDIAGMTGELQRDTDRSDGAWADRSAWGVYLSGPLAKMMPGDAREVWPYVAAWVADDPADADGNPGADTNKVLRIHVTALGPGGMRAEREAVVDRAPTDVVRVRAYWEPR